MRGIIYHFLFFARNMQYKNQREYVHVLCPQNRLSQLFLLAQEKHKNSSEEKSRAPSKKTPNDDNQNSQHNQTALPLVK